MLSPCSRLHCAMQVGRGPTQETPAAATHNDQNNRHVPPLTPSAVTHLNSRHSTILSP